MNVPVLDDKQEVFFLHQLCVKLGVVRKTSRERWMIGTDEERESGKSVLSEGLDIDDDDGDDDGEWFQITNNRNS